jgi:hypothetical protein
MKKPKAETTWLILDAKTFQHQLDQLATTIALKVHREGHKHIPKPAFVIPDIYYLLRQCQQTYNFFFFMSAEERRKRDPGYKMAYSIVILPLIRTMIDCLYNITAILSNPGPKGYQFRESGLGQISRALDRDEQKYGGDPKWDVHIAKYREFIELDMRRNDITEADTKAAQLWPTLSAYLRPKKNTPLTAHQQFLRTFTYGFWQEYSGISHATFQGLMPIGVFLVPNDLRHELRPMAEDQVDMVISLHISRAAAILLCTLTEVQAYFHFDRDQSARINQRLHKVWDALRVLPEIKELHDQRYAPLMREKGINP